MPKTDQATKSYVMFQNAGVSDLYALYLIGFTDKANDPTSIGMFGSGFKLALAAAMRLNIDLIVFLGRTKVTFRTAARHVHGRQIEQLLFFVEEPEAAPQELSTSLTLAYGAKDWKRPWVIFREMLANCRDADPHGYEVVAGVAPRGREGFTRVFVEATDEVMEVYRSLDCYYKEMRAATFLCDEGRIYPKCAPEGYTYFYCKGMYVLSTRDTSIYDFDLYHMPINESRDASTENLFCHVLRLFDCCPPDMKTEIVRFAIEQSQNGVQTLENSLYWSQTRRPDAWVEAFRRAFPDHVLCSFSDVEFQSMLRLGRRAVRANRELYRLLSTHGVQTAEQVLRSEEEGRREIFTPEGFLKENFQQAFERVARSLPELNRLSFSFIRLPPSQHNVSFITCSRARGEYQFSETLLKSGVKAVALAMIDALAQTKSLGGKCDLDYEQELMNIALECID